MNKVTERITTEVVAGLMLVAIVAYLVIRNLHGR